MTRLVVLALCLCTVPSLAGSKKPKRQRHDALGVIQLNGVRTAVRWTDGDSFQVKDGEWRGHGSRLVGYNTLEAYGPVHSWGTWTAPELYVLALSAAPAAAAGEWTCTTDGKQDGYRRLLVDCPELAVELVRQGLALAYAVDGERPAPRVLAAQRDAQANRRGMWAKGVVKGVVTSVHAVGEGGSDHDTQTYNRVVDTRTGQALQRGHDRTWGTCELVCEDTEGDRSCMIYVPFRQRYRQRPPCLE